MYGEKKYFSDEKFEKVTGIIKNMFEERTQVYDEIRMLKTQVSLLQNRYNDALSKIILNGEHRYFGQLPIKGKRVMKTPFLSKIVFSVFPLSIPVDA